jgi:hypothetical protein
VAGFACIADLPADQPVPPAPGCGDGYVDLAAGEECDPGLGSQSAAIGGCGSDCKVDCPGMVLPTNLHCYELASADQTTLDPGARGACSKTSAHVVTFASEEEFQAVAKYVQATDAGPFWVGLWHAPQFYNPVVDYEPGWSPTCPGCYAHTPNPSAPLPRAVTLTDGGGPVEQIACVKAFSDPARRSWEAAPCRTLGGLHVVCEREPVGVHSKACEAGVCIELVATQTTKRYVYRASLATSEDAEADCRSLGGSLVVLESRDEREQLWRELSRLTLAQSRIWIGLSPTRGAAVGDAGADAALVWQWDDGTNAEAPDAHPLPWAIGEPAEATRAMLTYETQRPRDNTLADTDTTAIALPYVSQIPVSDAGG